MCQGFSWRWESESKSFVAFFTHSNEICLFHIKGTTAVSGSDDKTIIVWETLRGLALTSLQLHVQFTRFDISLECSRILVHLTDNPSFPIICLHNSPAQYIKLPTYSAPARDVEGEWHQRLRVTEPTHKNYFPQIYDQQRQNVPLEGCWKRSCLSTRIRGRRSTLTWRPPSWWLRSTKDLSEDFPCRRAWRRSRKLLRWKALARSRILAIRNRLRWLSRSTLISWRRYGTSGLRRGGAWIRWEEVLNYHNVLGGSSCNCEYE